MRPTLLNKMDGNAVVLDDTKKRVRQRAVVLEHALFISLGASFNSFVLQARLSVLFCAVLICSV